MVEALPGPAPARLQPDLSRRLEQLVGADDVGLDEGVGPVDRAVDVRLRGEVDEQS